MIHLLFLKDTIKSIYVKVSTYEVSFNKILLMIHLLFLKDTIKSIYLKVSSYEVSFNKIL